MADEAVFVRVRCGVEESSVVIYEGIPVEELAGLLRGGFSAAAAPDRVPVGLRDDRGALVPLSAACRYPGLVRGGGVYTLVVYVPGPPDASPDAVGNGLRAAGGGGARGREDAASGGSSGDDSGSEGGELSPAGEEAVADAVREQLLEFVGALHSAGSLGDAEADAVQVRGPRGTLWCGVV